MRVTRETNKKNKMATSRAASSTATVALALQELALSRGDQSLLTEFVTEYFTSEDHELSSGK